MGKMKRVVVKEELVALTGDYKRAVVLGQLLYWSERVRNFKAYIEEEKERGASGKAGLEHGWMYKKADELVEETMLTISHVSMRRVLISLVNDGWIDERRNPRTKWDHTLQYRVNLNTVQADLFRLGYRLCDYRIRLESLDADGLDEGSDGEDLYADLPELQDVAPEVPDARPGVQEVGTIPEITSEITTEITTQEIPYAKIVDMLNSQAGKSFKAENEETRELIRQRWQEGYDTMDFSEVITKKTRTWKDNPEMNRYLRPFTLFGHRFESYLNETSIQDPKEEPKDEDFENLLKELREDDARTDGAAAESH
ncbi:conserved phage C-terminal domain-containing protein [Alteribacter natronophilus]|uniref:conserved phage C-terminal domain-containing protein n=1 Tax=Alteribacter natronophilus TaxID=2583810 RepID=UPI00110DFB10|nr:conserved phage C-terminal domain-containing protein [Alteribacter natronophilus]TMW72769.1 hypothetical protein FGB90_00200 [Alteribacter natronophilus]